MLDALSGARIARMSGSGATCFGLYSSEADRDAAAARIAAARPGWWLSPNQAQMTRESRNGTGLAGPLTIGTRRISLWHGSCV